MRHNNAQWWRISGWFILISALLVGGAGKVRAQVPVFDGIDWVADRGGRDQTGLATSSNMDYFRRGYNWFWITDPPGGPPSKAARRGRGPPPPTVRRGDPAEGAWSSHRSHPRRQMPLTARSPASRAKRARRSPPLRRHQRERLRLQNGYTGRLPR